MDYEDDGREQPVDTLVVWSMVYSQLASSYYGHDSTLVLSPERDVRGVDLNYLSAQVRRGYSLRDQASGTRSGQPSCSDLARGVRKPHYPGDLGQIATPGYHEGTSLRAFELRDADGWCSGCKGTPIELAFYRSHTPTTAEPIVLVVMPHGHGDKRRPLRDDGDDGTECIVAAEGAYYSCGQYSNRDCSGVPSATRVGDDARPLPVVAAIFRAREGGAHESLPLCQDGAGSQRNRPGHPMQTPWACHTAHFCVECAPSLALALSAPRRTFRRCTPCVSVRKALDVALAATGGRESVRDRALSSYPRVLAAIGSARLACKRGNVRVLSADQECEELLSDPRYASDSFSHGQRVVPARFGWEAGDWRGAIPTDWRHTSQAESSRELDDELCPRQAGQAASHSPPPLAERVVPLETPTEVPSAPQATESTGTTANQSQHAAPTTATSSSSSSPSAPTLPSLSAPLPPSPPPSLPSPALSPTPTPPPLPPSLQQPLLSAVALTSAGAPSPAPKPFLERGASEPPTVPPAPDVVATSGLNLVAMDPHVRPYASPWLSLPERAGETLLLLPATYATAVVVIGIAAACIFCVACILCMRARARFYRRVLQRSDACDAELEAAASPCHVCASARGAPLQPPWHRREVQRGNGPLRTRCDELPGTVPPRMGSIGIQVVARLQAQAPRRAGW